MPSSSAAAQDADRREVVRGDDGGRAACGAQQLVPDPSSGGVRPVTRHAYGVQAGITHRRLVARAAQSAHLALADDVGDPSVAQLQQVRRGEVAAAVVVVGYDVDGRQERLAGAGDDGGDLAPQAIDLVDGRCRRGADQHEAVDAQVGERLNGVGLGTAVGEKRAEAVVVKDRAESVEQLDVPGVGQIVDHDADGPGAALGEAACDRVRSVPELGDGLEHGLPLLLAYSGGVLQHQGYQGLRDTCPCGDGADRRGSVGGGVSRHAGSRRSSSSPRSGPHLLSPAPTDRPERTCVGLDKSNHLQPVARVSRSLLDRSIIYCARWSSCRRSSGGLGRSEKPCCERPGQQKSISRSPYALLMAWFPIAAPHAKSKFELSPRSILTAHASVCHIGPVQQAMTPEEG